MVDSNIDFTQNYMQDRPALEEREYEPDLEQKRDDNMYKYHDNTQVFDPKT